MLNSFAVDEGPRRATGVNQRKSVPPLLSRTGLDGVHLKSAVAPGDVEIVNHKVTFAAPAEGYARHAVR